MTPSRIARLGRLRLAAWITAGATPVGVLEAVAAVVPTGALGDNDDAGSDAVDEAAHVVEHLTARYGRALLELNRTAAFCPTFSCPLISASGSDRPTCAASPPSR